MKCHQVPKSKGEEVVLLFLLNLVLQQFGGALRELSSNYANFPTQL